MDVFFDYVASDTGAFRLVFESDLTNEPAVREHVDRVTTECAAMIADVIHDDTGLPDDASRLLAVSLVGMAQVSARFWLSDARRASTARTPPPWWPGWPGAGSAATRSPTSTDHRTTAATAIKEDLVEVKIGVQNAARELTSTSTRPPRPSRSWSPTPSPATACSPHRHQGPPHHRPGAKIAYVEIGHGTAGQVGFR